MALHSSSDLFTDRLSEEAMLLDAREIKYEADEEEDGDKRGGGGDGIRVEKLEVR